MPRSDIYVLYIVQLTTHLNEIIIKIIIIISIFYFFQCQTNVASIMYMYCICKKKCIALIIVYNISVKELKSFWSVTVC